MFAEDFLILNSYTLYFSLFCISISFFLIFSIIFFMKIFIYIFIFFKLLPIYAKRSNVASPYRKFIKRTIFSNLLPILAAEII